MFLTSNLLIDPIDLKIENVLERVFASSQTFPDLLEGKSEMPERRYLLKPVQLLLSVQPMARLRATWGR